MAIVITASDFEAVGQLAAHIDTSKLRVATREAILFDMERLMPDFWWDVETNWESVDPLWRNLIDGGEYVGCKDKTKRHEGLKMVLVYFIYARYVVLNNFDDTPNGHVTKTNNFSLPKPLKELHSFSEKYYNMGIALWDGVEDYLCRKIKAEKQLDNVVYENYDTSDCPLCGEELENRGTNVGFGIRSKNISRWDA